MLQTAKIEKKTMTDSNASSRRESC